MTRNINIGHYIAICSRVVTWIEYSDLDKKERHIKERNIMITPVALIYAKKKKINLLIIINIVIAIIFIIFPDP